MTSSEDEKASEPEPAPVPAPAPSTVAGPREVRIAVPADTELQLIPSSELDGIRDRLNTMEEKYKFFLVFIMLMMLHLTLVARAVHF